MARPDAEPLTSLEHPQVKLARSLHEQRGRRRHGAFLVEGLRLVEAATQRLAPQLVFHTPSFGHTTVRAAAGRERALLHRLRQAGVLVRPVSERVLQHIADTATPQGIVAVLALPADQGSGAAAQPAGDPAPGQARPLPVAPGARAPAAGGPLDLVLDAVTDPGNAGTLLRSAVAAGVWRVLCAPGTVDVYAPKVVRAGAGAHFHVRLVAASWDEIAGALRGQAVYLADAAGARPYWDVAWTQPAALVVSNEAHGASAAARQLAAGTVAIPMAGGVESLNAGVAGSVILFEARRQRLIHGLSNTRSSNRAGACAPPGEVE
jgi:TrmH family RNA methyltransferase